MTCILWLTAHTVIRYEETFAFKYTWFHVEHTTDSTPKVLPWN